MNSLLKVVVFLIPSTILLFVLFKFFPNTGLGRILTTPMTYAINIGLIGLGFLIIHLLKKRYSTLVWVIVIVLTLIVTIWLYPQQSVYSKPHIIFQIWDMIKGE